MGLSAGVDITEQSFCYCLEGQACPSLSVRAGEDGDAGTDFPVPVQEPGTKGHAAMIQCWWVSGRKLI